MYVVRTYAHARRRAHLWPGSPFVGSPAAGTARLEVPPAAWLIYLHASFCGEAKPLVIPLLCAAWGASAVVGPPTYRIRLPASVFVPASSGREFITRAHARNLTLCTCQVQKIPNRVLKHYGGEDEVIQGADRDISGRDAPMVAARTPAPVESRSSRPRLSARPQTPFAGAQGGGSIQGQQRHRAHSQ